MNKLIAKFIPDVELPKWFEVVSQSGEKSTKLTFVGFVGGRTIQDERVIDKDAVNVAELLRLFPFVDEIPAKVLLFLSFVPVPRYCKISGAPSPIQDIPNVEKARLSVEAKVFSSVIQKHWDSELDKLYMRDLLEIIDVLKAATRGSA